MRAFVIKNKEGKYWSTSFDYEGKPLLTDDIVDAMPYDDVDIQMVKCPNDCEVVEITIAEGDLEKEIEELRKQTTNDEQDVALYQCQGALREAMGQIKDKDQQISDLQKENEVLRRALRLSCEMIGGMTVWKKEEYDKAVKDCADYFIQQAKEMLNKN